MSTKKASRIETDLEAAVKAQQDLEDEFRKLQADQAYVVERTKLAATSWSNLATNLVTVAVFTPAVGLVYNDRFFDPTMSDPFHPTIVFSPKAPGKLARVTKAGT